MIIRYALDKIRTSGDPLLDVTAMPEPPAWTVHALCAQTDPEAFFPDNGGSTRAAKATCAVCPVRAQCLAWALENREQFGVWGGLSPRQRRKLEHGDVAS